MKGQERLDEVVVSTPFDLNAAIDSIRFYWNLARHKGENIVVEVWGPKKDSTLPYEEVIQSQS